MKNILIAICFLGVSISCTIEKGNLSAENGKLSGIITYRNSYASSKMADAGSEIYVISEADVKSGKYNDVTEIIETFQRNKSYYLESVNTSLDPVRNNKLWDNFDTISNFTDQYLGRFTQLPGIIKAVSNEAGNYTLSLKPGKYYILVHSGSVKNRNIAEIKGAIDFIITDIRSAGETFLNFNFNKQERITGFALNNYIGC